MVAQAEDVMPQATRVREKLNKAFELIVSVGQKHGCFSRLYCSAWTSPPSNWCILPTC
jgi:hypothetical protein